jgi:hypothetical protein
MTVSHPLDWRTNADLGKLVHALHQDEARVSFHKFYYSAESLGFGIAMERWLYPFKELRSRPDLCSLYKISPDGQRDEDRYINGWFVMLPMRDFNMLTQDYGCDIHCPAVKVKFEHIYHTQAQRHAHFKGSYQTVWTNIQLCGFGIRNTGCQPMVAPLNGPEYFWQDSGDSDVFPDMLMDARTILYSRRSNDELFNTLVAAVDPKRKMNEDQIKHLYKCFMTACDAVHRDVESIITASEGFTSMTGFPYGGLWFKVDIPRRLGHENKVYELDLGRFDDFRPKKRHFFTSDSTAVLVLEDLINYETGVMKACKKFGGMLESKGLPTFQHHDIAYSVFLMALFHTEARRHVASFDLVPYQGVHGVSLLDEVDIPHVNLSGMGLRRFKESAADAAQAAKIVVDYLQKRDELALDVIHGDFKRQNIVRGHLVDVAMAGRGRPVDELAFFLSDTAFQYGTDRLHAEIDRYCIFRSLLDPEFGDDRDRHASSMHRDAAAAWLTQLVLRNAVHNKRNLEQRDKFIDRLYYKWRSDETLRGKFLI